MTDSYFEHETIGTGLLVKLGESVDSTNFGSVVERIVNFIEDQPTTDVCLDMSNVDYLYSTALGHLVKLHKIAQLHGGTLQLCDLEPSCRKVLAVTQLDRILRVHATADVVRALWSGTPSNDPPAVVASRDSVGGLDQGVVLERLIVDSRNAVRDDREWGGYQWMARPDLIDSQHVRVARTRITSGSAQPFHQHPEVEEILYVLSGSAELWIERNARHISAGQLVVVPPGRVHAVVNESNGELDCVNVFSPGVVSGAFEIGVGDREPWKSLNHGRGVRQFDVEREGDALYVRVDAERIVEPSQIGRFQSALEQLAAREAPARLIVDLERVQHIATGVLGALNRVRERLKQDSAVLEVCGLGDEVARIFEITQLGRIIPIHTNRAAARRSEDQGT